MDEKEVKLVLVGNLTILEPKIEYDGELYYITGEYAFYDDDGTLVKAGECELIAHETQIIKIYEFPL